MDSHYQLMKEMDLREEDSKSLKKYSRSKLSSKRYYVGPAYPGIYFTQRELEIAVLLVQGNRYKTIGECLSISIRSVEDRVKHLKEKFKCLHKKALIDTLRDIIPHSKNNFKKTGF